MSVHSVDDGVRRIFFVQALLVTLVSAASAPLAGGRFALAVLYGGAIALVAGWLAYRSVSRVRNADEKAGAALFGGLALRFAVMIALFAVAFGLLHLSPLPLILGFVAAQFAAGVAHFTD